MTPIYSSHIIHWINIIPPRACIPGLVSIICEFVSFDFDTNIFLPFYFLNFYCVISDDMCFFSFVFIWVPTTNSLSLFIILV